MVVFGVLVSYVLVFCNLVDRADSGLWQVFGLFKSYFLCFIGVLLLFGWFSGCLLACFGYYSVIFYDQTESFGYASQQESRTHLPGCYDPHAESFRGLPAITSQTKMLVTSNAFFHAVFSDPKGCWHSLGVHPSGAWDLVPASKKRNVSNCNKI